LNEKENFWRHPDRVAWFTTHNLACVSQRSSTRQNPNDLILLPRQCKCRFRNSDTLS
jgi:hypothetical protein